MNLSIGKKFGIGFCIALAALLVMGIMMNINLQQLNSDAGMVTHTVEVQQKVSVLRADILQAESSVRGFQLLPMVTFRNSFDQAETHSRAALQALRKLTTDNESQQNRLDLVESQREARLKDLRDLLNLPPGEAAAATRESLVRGGIDKMSEIHRLLDAVMDEEQRLLNERQISAARIAQITSGTIIYGTLLACVLVSLTGLVITRSITIPLQALSDGAHVIGGGNYAHRVEIKSSDEVGTLATHFNLMASQVQERQKVQADLDWVKTSLARFAALFQGQRDKAALCRNLLTELADVLKIQHGLIYTVDTAHDVAPLQFQAGYAFDPHKTRLQAGEGLAGQAFADKRRITMDRVPSDYFKVNSALGESLPRAVTIQPAAFEGEVKAVLELASLEPFTPLQLSFLDQLAASIGVVLNTIAASMRTEELLRQAQLLSESLKAGQEELSRKNSELELQTRRLQSSEMQLKEQQEELKQTNEELEQTNEEMEQTNAEMEEKVNLLAEQKTEMERVNRAIEQAREELEKRAAQIAQASRYKSEFLANMSHELRTPLNSLLILSKLLADNSHGNLTEKEVQYARTIYSSGNDLLELINEILDLAKIESGAIDFRPEPMPFKDFRAFIEGTFKPVAENKHLHLDLEFDPDLPASISTDSRRLQQIIKNLLSNALKFTERGSITMRVAPVTSGWDRPNRSLDGQAKVIAFSVTDSGIGIPDDKKELIFEAFQQGDSGTARKYGGTGLGLSISRELAIVLGGSLQLTKTSEQGSTFTFYVPESVQKADRASAREHVPRVASPQLPSPSHEHLHQHGQPAVTSAIEDDAGRIIEGDMVLLIIDDDRNFAGIMRDFAREKRFKVLTAANASDGIALAMQTKPSAILLDLRLPDNDGWLVLDRLKHDPATRHIPIHIISVDQERERSLRSGAVSYLQKPVTKEALDEALNQSIDFINRPVKNLLIIEDDPVQRQALVDLIGDQDVKSTAVGSASEAFTALQSVHFDCVVLDLGLPDVNGLQLIRDIQQKLGAHSPPIVVYTGKELTREEETELRMVSDSIVIKNVRSPERLLDETALFLHRVQSKLPESKQRIIERVQKSDSLLAGRKVLVVDDDVRNIFAITSALEAFKMEVSYAESGQAALDMLDKKADFDVVLMDIMMPEMDGFEAIRRIRQMEKFRKLPIISVTAKAMRDDREKCLQAGASEYITKPVDMDQLRSLLRVWLYR